MKRKIKADYLLLILALVVLAAGIGGALLRRPAKAVPALVFTQWWHNEFEPGVLEDFIEEFEQNHGNIKIVLNSLSYEEARKLLFDYYDTTGEDETEAVPAPFTGDILALDQLWIPELYQNGVLDPSFPPSEPLVSFFHPLFYNIEMLRNAGFSRPPRTRSELLSFAQAVTDPEAGRYGIGFALGEHNSRGVYQEIYPWFWASGVSLINGGRAFEETLDFFSSLYRENVIHPRIFTMGEEEKRQAFINNRIAFMTGPVQEIEILRREMGEDAFSVSIIPGADSYVGKPVFGATDWSLGVFRGSAHPEEAAAFISFMVEKSPLLAPELLPPDANALYSKIWELYIAGDFMRAVELPEDAEIISRAERETIFRETLLELFEEKHTPSSAARAIREGWGY